MGRSLMRLIDEALFPGTAENQRRLERDVRLAHQQALLGQEAVSAVRELHVATNRVIVDGMLEAMAYADGEQLGRVQETVQHTGVAVRREAVQQVARLSQVRKRDTDVFDDLRDAWEWFKAH